MASDLRVNKIQPHSGKVVITPGTSLDGSDCSHIALPKVSPTSTPSSSSLTFDTSDNNLKYYNSRWRTKRLTSQRKSNYNVVKSGLVLYLDAGDPDSYPGSGNYWYDISGRKNHFVSNNAISYSNNAMNFTLGSTDSFYNPIATEDFRFTSTDFTHEMWILMDTSGDATNTYYWVWNLGPSRSSGQGDDVYMNQWRSGLRPGELFNRFNTLVTLGYAGTLKLSGLGWTHLVLQSVSGVARWYWNGVLKESVTVPGYNTTAGGRYMELGGRPLGSGYGGSFSGSISQVRTYTRALSESEILNNYNETRSIFGV